MDFQKKSPFLSVQLAIGPASRCLIEQDWVILARLPRTGCKAKEWRHRRQVLGLLPPLSRQQQGSATFKRREPPDGGFCGTANRNLWGEHCNGV
jgi:hypothetical protein